MEEPVGKCVSLSETSTVKIPMEVSEDSEAAFLLETSIDWDSFPTGETGGMSGPDEAGEDTKTEEAIVVPDPLIPDKIPTGTENLPTTDIPLTDHPTVDPPPVSYTHLDVYKRQRQRCMTGRIRSARTARC